MNEPLRPSSLGEILDRTAQLYRSRFLVFLGISVLPTGVVLALACVAGLVAAWWGTSGAHSVSKEAGYILVALFALGVALLALPILLAVTALAAAAMSHAVSRVYLGGTTTIRDAYKIAWRIGWRSIGLYLLQAIFVAILPTTAWIVLLLIFGAIAALAQKAGMGNLADGAFVGLLAFLALVAVAGYGIWMLLRMSLAFPACVVEQKKAWSAVKRSFALSQGTKGRIFLLFLLVAALAGGFVFGAQLIVKRLLLGTQNGFHFGHLFVPSGVAPIVHFPVDLVELRARVVEDPVQLGDLRVVQLDALAHLLHQPFPYLFRIRPGTLMGARRGRRQVVAEYGRRHIEVVAEGAGYGTADEDCQQTEKRKKAGLGHGNQLIGPVRSTPAAPARHFPAYPACWRPPVLPGSSLRELAWRAAGTRRLRWQG